MKYAEHAKLLAHFDQLSKAHGIENELNTIQFREHMVNTLKIKTEARISKMALAIRFAHLQDYLEKIPNFTISDVENVLDKSDSDLEYLYSTLKVDSKQSVQEIYNIFLLTAEKLQEGCEIENPQLLYNSIDDFFAYRKENELKFNSNLRSYRRNYYARELTEETTGACKAFYFEDSSVIVLSELKGDSIEKRIDNLALATVKLANDNEFVEHEYFLTLNDQLTFQFDDEFPVWLEPEITICCLFPDKPAECVENDTSSVNDGTQYVEHYSLVAVLGSLFTDAESYRIFDLREISEQHMYELMGWPVLAYYKRVIEGDK